MSIQTIVQPASEPVTTAIAKVQCRIDGTDLDDVLAIYIKAAREAVETRTSRRLITQTVRQRIDGFPTSDDIELEVGPAQSITEIRYLDTLAAWRVLASTSYSLDAQASPGYVLLDYDVEWPSTLDAANCVEIDYVVGYTSTAADLPASVRTWVLAAVAYQVDNPAGGEGALGDFVDRLLDGVSYREP